MPYGLVMPNNCKYGPCLSMLFENIRDTTSKNYFLFIEYHKENKFCKKHKILLIFILNLIMIGEKKPGYLYSTKTS